ncbi:MAG TPA: indole-3-glycerol-phosphate synthase [Spirochaetota bacterium]|nr:indole-3-glycerol-phosphate synthase [Spirochaetota bacterium]HPJ35168.1 indole-3-glycerol-phosphate synthase [Spirochaetota bacterium]
MKRFSLTAMKDIKRGEIGEMKKISSAFTRNRLRHSFRDALDKGINVIAELKHSSPSHGVMDGHLTDSVRITRYVYGGASALSILSEREYFGGSYEGMKRVADEASVPVLCKDFVFFREQIDAAYVCGADMVLLIARALEKSELEDFFHAAKEKGMEPIVEICEKNELEKLGGIDPEFVMVNMRDLESLEINFDRGIETLNALPAGVTAISASGINSRGDVEYIKSRSGVNNFLIGAGLMKHSEPDVFIRELKNVC